VLLILALTTMTVAFTTTLIFAHASHAVASTTKTINFQGRLLTAAGSVVPDGTYNIQFKIYQGGSGAAAGNPDGSLKWTETYANNGASTGVEVKDGFLSVNLGSVNPFGTTVDWNQDTLWLSINVAGSAAGCSSFGTSPCVADGEMLPMKQITATPYAINSSQLGGITATGFLQNTTTQQTADFNISGNGQVATLQGNTSLLTPLLDASTTNGTLAIGQSAAADVEIGTADSRDQTINIGTGNANKTITIGTQNNVSSLTLQGGTGSIAVVTGGGFTVRNKGTTASALSIDSGGNTDFTLSPGSLFHIKNGSGVNLFSINSNLGEIHTNYGSKFFADGDASFAQGITIQGNGSLQYVTPGGASLPTMINIPNYTVGAYGTILAFGLPSTSAATARGLLVADGRTSSHQATIGVLSPDENAIMGLSWNGSNSVGAISNTANTLALQGNGLNLLTATNAGGSANVGIGNSAAAGFALDVTGDVNSSTQYRINGNVALSNTALNFGGASASTVTSASGQSLNLNGITGVSIQNNGTTSASFGSNVQIGSGSGSGTPTLLSLDKATSAPSLSGSAMNGSMYYDTTLDQVQCYEAGAWGKCTASPDDFVSLSPEYSNAVLHGSTTGTMTSDLCSDALNINDGSSSQPTICGTNETYNFYNWTSSSTSNQTRSVYVTYQLPSSFKQFVSGSTSLTGRTDSTDGTVAYQAYKNTASGLTACGASTAVSTGVQTTWQKATATSTADPATCSFSAGDSIVFRVDMTAKNSANAYASNLNFAFSNN
jgi:hypothetical protein